MASTSAAAAAARPPPNTAPRSQEDLPDDMIWIITEILLQQKSPAFDERDIARNAASCMCVGSPAFTSMGKALYKGISPRLGGDTEGVTDSSPQPKMKELLKKWKLPVGGSKPQLWRRINNQVTVGEEGNEELCPCAGATKELVEELATARVSVSRAKKEFQLGSSALESLPHELATNKQGTYHTYSLTDVKRKCLETYGNWAKIEANTARSKEWSENWNRKKDEKKGLVADVLRSRGISEDRVELGVRHMWHLFYEFEAEQTDKVAAAADMIHSFIWHVDETSFPWKLQVLRAGFKYAGSKSKYKQEVALEERAMRMGMESWVATQDRPLDTLLADPVIPACMHPAIQAAWAKVNA